MSHPSKDDSCPIDALLSLIAGPWTAMIIWYLKVSGPQRFSHLEKLVHGITPRMLSMRLKKLEKEMIVQKNTSDFKNAVPIQAAYSLTQYGQGVGTWLQSATTIKPQ